MGADFPINENTNIRELVARFPRLQAVFARYGLPCAGCHVASYETISQGAGSHGIAVEGLLTDLRQAVQNYDPSPTFVEKGQPSIGRIIAIASGKGGVGKSSVTGLLAVTLARRGKKVGILDADITGPSIPKMFGLSERIRGEGGKMMPAETALGIKVVSTNLLVEREDTPVIWRGPLVAQAIRQFYLDVLWGELDYLLVDVPPGTSDAPLTILKSLPVDGVVLVSSPQEITGVIVKKAVALLQRLGVPIIGVVENMSYFLCPDNGRQYQVFGPSKGEEMALAARTSFLGSLPIDPELARLCDAGRIETYTSEAYADLAETFLREIVGREALEYERLVGEE